MVTGNYFDALGVGAGTRGRLFTEADGEPGRPPVVVLSDTAWRKRFGADLSAIGRTIRLHRALFTIVGVAPAGFTGTQIGYSPDIWVTADAGASHRRQHRRCLDRHRRGWDWPGFSSVPIAWRRCARPSTAGGRRRDAARRGRPPDSSRPPVVHAGAREPPAAHRSLLGADPDDRVPQRIDAARRRPCTRDRRSSPSDRRSVQAGCGCCDSCSPSICCSRRWAEWPAACSGQWMARGLAPLMASRFTPGDLDVSTDLTVVLFTCGVSLAAAAAIGVMPALRWSHVNTLPALQGQTGGLTRLFRSHRAVVADSLAGRTRDRPPRVGGTAGEDRAAAEARHPGRRRPSASGLRTCPSTIPEAIGPVVGFPGTTSSPPPVDARRRGGRAELGPAARVDSPRSAPCRGHDDGSRQQADAVGTAASAAAARRVRLEKQWIVSQNYVTPGYFRGARAADAPRPGFHERRRRRCASRRDRQRDACRARVREGEPHRTPRVVRPGPGPFDIEIVGVVRDLRYEHLREAAPDGHLLSARADPSRRGRDADGQRRYRADQSDAHAARARRAST